MDLYNRQQVAVRLVFFPRVIWTGKLGYVHDITNLYLRSDHAKSSGEMGEPNGLLHVFRTIYY